MDVSLSERNYKIIKVRPRANWARWLFAHSELSELIVIDWVGGQTGLTETYGCSERNVVNKRRCER